MANRLRWSLFAGLFMFMACSTQESPDEPVEADLFVTGLVSSITWTDQTDLVQKLSTVVNFGYGSARQSQVDELYVYPPDSSQVRISIDFKPEFQGQYLDPDQSNNSATIGLNKEIVQPSNAVELKADGPGDTYELLTSVLAPGYDPLETPDCGHPSFGQHIDELWDADLNSNVFRFHLHTEPDNDRCINFDRQRNEIKSYDKSPDNLLGVVGEKVRYIWKFKLAAGFQSSPNFTHLHQLKSVGGDLASSPMYTLTTRKGTPDRLELRYAETDSQITLKQTDLAPLIGVWLEVSETIEYGESGSYEVSISRVDNGQTLFEYSNNSLVNWRPGGSFVRPKWGIYRSLLNAQDLRDEEVLFADFSIEELED